MNSTFHEPGFVEASAFAGRQQAVMAALDEHAIVAITDPQGRITYANDKFCAISGYSRPELLGQDHRLINSVHPPREFFRDLWASFARGQVWKGEIKNQAKDGSFYWVDTTLVPFLDEAGQPRQYVAIRADITERKRAEVAAARLAAIVSSSDDAIVAKDLSGVVTSWNAGAEHIFGYRAEEMEGRSITTLIPAERQDEETDILQHIRRGESVRHLETVRLRKDGSQIPVSITVSAIRDAAGRIIGASKVARDITERRRTEELIRQLNTQLEQRVAERTVGLEAANRELESFSYSVSHDLRAPLRGIDGFSRTLLEKHAGQLDEHGQHYLARIRAATQRMGRLIDDLLELARLSRGDLDRVPLDLSALAAGIGAELRQAHPDRQVEFVVAPALATRADPILIRVALANLLANAWKFSAKQARPRIELGAIRHDGQSVFFVRDNGAGFDMAYAAKLFSPFQRLHGQQEFEGTGVGLATVQRIIHRHGGRIWADAQVGRGASFHFTLPD